MSLFAEQGFEVVNSYFRETYFDFDDYCILEKLENWVPSSSPEVAKGSEHLIVGGEMCAWGETPAHYSYSLPSGFLIFGDRLWNHEIYKYDEEYYKGVTKAILGPQTPAGFNVFTYLGSAFLPRDNVRKGFPDAVTASIEEIDNAIQILTDIDKKAPFFCIYTARAYKGCLEWIKAEKLNPTPKNDAE